jgi:hypothetical protein
MLCVVSGSLMPPLQMNETLVDLLPSLLPAGRQIEFAEALRNPAPIPERVIRSETVPVGIRVGFANPSREAPND